MNPTDDEIDELLARGGAATKAALLDALRALRDQRRELLADRERLDWLESEADGIAVIHDDFESWAVASDGMQDMQRHDDKTQPLSTMYLIDADAFRATLRAAIDAARAKESR